MSRPKQKYHISLHEFLDLYGTNIDDRIISTYTNIKLDRDKKRYMWECSWMVDNNFILPIRIVCNRLKDNIRIETANLTQHEYYLLRKNNGTKQTIKEVFEEWFNCTKSILFQIREA